MARTIGDFNNNILSAGDPEILFEIEDERWRESYRQLIENIQILLAKTESHEKRIRELEER
jgi:hypothetical protein